MNATTNTKTAASSLALATVPIQTGPAYCCFTCGAPAQGLRTWAELPKWDGYSPLDEWGEHIAYLKLPTCPSDHQQRVAKLGDCITPLAFVSHPPRGEWNKMVAENIQAIRDALAAIAAAVPEAEREHDAASKLVYSLLAGTIPPSKAIDQIRALLASPFAEKGA